MILLWYLLIPLVAVNAREYSETEVLLRLPKFFHLDDYDRCLARRSGLYCSGVFALSPTKHPHPTYDFMKEYASNTKYHLNRTRIHRGYCVSSRCPSYTGNATSRFERCVADWARPRSFRADLHTLHYCKTGADAVKPKPFDSAELAFLCVVVAILAVNVVGTIYDYYCNDSSRATLLRIWSIRTNWNKLVNMDEGVEPRLNDLSPTYGMKAVPVLLMILGHCQWTHYIYLGYSPHFLESHAKGTYGKMATNLGALILCLLSLSAFIMSYNLLLISEKIKLNIKMLPMCLMKRISRTTPLLLLLGGFALTIITRAGHGPLWFRIEQEKEMCKEKFWTYPLYLSNILYTDNICGIHIWGLTVDLQLSVITCSLTLVLARLRRRALPILACLIIVSCIVNTVLGYIFEWGPFRELMSMETVHRRFLNNHSFNYFYIQAWGSLPSSLIGVYAAHLYYEWQAEKYDMKQQKWLDIFAKCTIPAAIAVPLYLTRYDSLSRSTSALFIGFERPVVSIFTLCMLLGLIIFKGALYRFFSHPVFKFLGRLTLPITIISVPIHGAFLGNKTFPNAGSNLDLQFEGIATYVLSVLIAIPLSVLVEIPARRLFDALMFALIEKDLANLKINLKQGNITEDNDNKSKVE